MISDPGSPEDGLRLIRPARDGFVPTLLSLFTDWTSITTHWVKNIAYVRRFSVQSSAMAFVNSEVDDGSAVGNKQHHDLPTYEGVDMLRGRSTRLHDNGFYAVACMFQKIVTTLYQCSLCR